jgi:hypothetical protein
MIYAKFSLKNLNRFISEQYYFQCLIYFIFIDTLFLFMASTTLVLFLLSFESIFQFLISDQLFRLKTIIFSTYCFPCFIVLEVSSIYDLVFLYFYEDRIHLNFFLVGNYYYLNFIVHAYFITIIYNSFQSFSQIKFY